ncbi:hypothetical protein NUW58_g7494 [Xylaria curta]|uniref:Uncharacterized protein n=1 Tax=Xylaria curta TaxID=42375 RepID=A0ACC1NHV7_9PEZI|nr:hypothetical protein NUW58_g7494 [Xylaria curta]
MATEKKPIVLTMTSRLRSRSNVFLNRLFKLHHGSRDIKPASSEWQPTDSPNRVIRRKKTFPGVVVPEKGTLPSQPVDTTTYSRPIGTLEWFFKRLGDKASSANREHAAFFTVLQLEFPPHIINAEDYIARAWEVIGRRFPALRAEISPPDEDDTHQRSRVTVRPFNKHNFRGTFTVHPDCPNVDVLFGTASPYTEHRHVLLASGSIASSASDSALASRRLRAGPANRRLHEHAGQHSAKRALRAPRPTP